MRGESRLGRQRGGIVVAFAVFAVVWLGIMGMILDLGQALNRRAELQGIADNAALAGARLLNGTSAGITAAANAARSRADQVHYGYRPLTLPDDALAFAASPDAPAASWQSVTAAGAAPAGLLFMRIDAGAVASTSGVQYGNIATSFIRLLAPDVTNMEVGGSAVAGRFGNASTIVQLYR